MGGDGAALARAAAGRVVDEVHDAIAALLTEHGL